MKNKNLLLVCLLSSVTLASCDMSDIGGILSNLPSGIVNPSTSENKNTSTSVTASNTSTGTSTSTAASKLNIFDKDVVDAFTKTAKDTYTAYQKAYNEATDTLGVKVGVKGQVNGAYNVSTWTETVSGSKDGETITNKIAPTTTASTISGTAEASALLNYDVSYYKAVAQATEGSTVEKTNKTSGYVSETVTASAQGENINTNVEALYKNGSLTAYTSSNGEEANMSQEGLSEMVDTYGAMAFQVLELVKDKTPEQLVEYLTTQAEEMYKQYTESKKNDDYVASEYDQYIAMAEAYAPVVEEALKNVNEYLEGTITSAQLVDNVVKAISTEENPITLDAATKLLISNAIDNVVGQAWDNVVSFTKTSTGYNYTFNYSALITIVKSLVTQYKEAFTIAKESELAANVYGGMEKVTEYLAVITEVEEFIKTELPEGLIYKADYVVTSGIFTGVNYEFGATNLKISEATNSNIDSYNSETGEYTATNQIEQYTIKTLTGKVETTFEVASKAYTLKDAVKQAKKEDTSTAA